MLKPMKPKSNFPGNATLWGLVGLLVVAGVVVLILSFNSSNSADEVEAIYTNAAETLAAQQLTLEAAQPTATETLPPTPTATVTPFATLTLPAAPILVSPTKSGSSGTSGAVGCNNSEFVTDVTVPDDTVVTPGQTITKTWKLRNTGTCEWTATFKVSFLNGNAMSGNTTPIGVAVPPGQSADVTVVMTAPSTPGDVTGFWILTNDSGQNFGSWFYIRVKVGGASGTVTVTPTSTGAVSIPAPANNPNIALSCTLGGNGGTQYEHAGTLSWEDKSNNETGFNIYVNGSLATSVSENTTSYNVPGGTFFDAGVPSTFGVEAFNSAGKATVANVIKQCP